MSNKDLKDKDAAALKNELVEQQKKLFELRSQAVTEKLEDPSQMGKARKQIARIKTQLRQQELAASKK